MKIKTILLIVLLTIVLYSFTTYLGMFLSEKYDTQLEGLNPTKEQINFAEKLKNKIERDKKIALSVIIISLVLIYPICKIKK
ncbi:MAG: hypothetical protein H7195_10425 [Chryseobacterium sp.]|nr:hypothetical protein [Chryseobacterium sp.]